MNTSTIFSSSLWNLLSLNYKLILWALLITCTVPSLFPVVAGTIDVSPVDITIIFQIWSMLADYEQ